MLIISLKIYSTFKSTLKRQRANYITAKKGNTTLKANKTQANLTL